MEWRKQMWQQIAQFEVGAIYFVAGWGLLFLLARFLWNNGGKRMK